MLRLFLFSLVTWSLEGQAITGPSVPQLAAFDQAVTGVMNQYRIPGAALAVTKSGKLLLAHGYGTLDPSGQTPVQPDSLFRIASLSKPITAVAILQLWDNGLIDLDKSAFGYLTDIQPIPGQKLNPQLAQITVRQLLQHSGGWDADNISVDPLDQTLLIAQQLGVTPPANSTAVIRAMLSRPLDFPPGSRFAYSNFGYLVLGRILEHITGMAYEDYVRTRILAPLGIERMRIGNSPQLGRLPGEAAYVSPGTAPTVFPFGPSPAPIGYGGGWELECMDANAGWVASAVDLVKFWNAIDGQRGGPLLTSAAIAQLVQRPSLPDYVNQNNWYGMGFEIVSSGSNSYWWKDGVLDGTRSLVVRTDSQYTWTVLFNTTGTADYAAAIDSALFNAKGQVASWPSKDLYPSFDTPNTNRPAVRTQDGVLNGASFQRGFTAGSWISLLGVNLSGSTRTWQPSDFNGSSLPLSLDGVSVNIGGKPAAIYYVSPTQLNVQVPTGLPVGGVTVEVIRNGVSSGPSLGEVRANAPALFTYSAGGTLYSAAIFSDGTLVGDPAKVVKARAAKPGDTISLYGSNLESSPAGSLVARPQTLSNLPTVKIGGLAAAVSYAGLVGAGLYQINITVPNIADGDLPISLNYAGAAAQSGVFLSIKR